MPGTGKATNFKFCTHIHRIDPLKPIKNFGKSSCGTPENFQPTHTWSTSRGRLCELRLISFLVFLVWLNDTYYNKRAWRNK